jgi:hypothetical protein
MSYSYRGTAGEWLATQEKKAQTIERVAMMQEVRAFLNRQKLLREVSAKFQRTWEYREIEMMGL